MVSNIGPISAKILKIDLRRLVVEAMAIHKKELDDWINNRDNTGSDLLDTGDFYEVLFKNPFRSPIAFKVEDEEPSDGEHPGRRPPDGPSPSQIIKKTLKKKYRDESRR